MQKTCLKGTEERGEMCSEAGKPRSLRGTRSLGVAARVRGAISREKEMGKREKKGEK